MIPLIALFTEKGRKFMKQNPVLFAILTLIAVAAGAVFYDWLQKTRIEKVVKD